jgi:hypothetical protein
VPLHSAATGRPTTGSTALSAISERWKKLWGDIQSAPAVMPSHVVIPPENTSGSAPEPTPFASRADYFEVVVDEMYLTTRRKWFVTHDPMVLAVTEFVYDDDTQAVPFVVGPALLGKGTKAPQGMLFKNTRVAGIHPFAGSRFVVTVILYSVERKNYAADVLRIVERAAGVLGFATPLTPYLKMAEMVFDGVQTLVGYDETQPLIGARVEYGGTSPLKPVNFALIDAPNVAPRSLRVNDSQLLDATGHPYRANGYVLCSIDKLPSRDDETKLPFYPLWERVLAEAAKPTPDAWESAKANMLSLMQNILLSPDLTEGQAEELLDTYERQMKAHHARAKRLAKMGDGDHSKFDDVRKRSVRILELD